MKMEGFGFGLAALAFWGFIAAVSVAGIWDGVRKRDAKHETLRRLMDKESNLDPATVEKLIETVDGGGKSTVKDLKVGGYITLAVAPGLAIMAHFLGKLSEEAGIVVTGASLLTGCVALGMLIAAKMIDDKKED